MSSVPPARRYSSFLKRPYKFQTLISRIIVRTQAENAVYSVKVLAATQEQCFSQQTAAILLCKMCDQTDTVKHSFQRSRYKKEFSTLSNHKHNSQ